MSYKKYFFRCWKNIKKMFKLIKIIRILIFIFYSLSMISVIIISAIYPNLFSYNLIDKHNQARRDGGEIKRSGCLQLRMGRAQPL